jgi:hypothetical protein
MPYQVTPKPQNFSCVADYMLSKGGVGIGPSRALHTPGRVEAVTQKGAKSSVTEKLSKNQRTYATTRDEWRFCYAHPSLTFLHPPLPSSPLKAA